LIYDPSAELGAESGSDSERDELFPFDSVREALRQFQSLRESMARLR